MPAAVLDMEPWRRRKQKRVTGERNEIADMAGIKIEVARSAEVRETSVDVPQFPTKHRRSRVHGAAVAPAPVGLSPAHVCTWRSQTRTDVSVHWLLKCIKAQLKEKVSQ